MSFAKNEVANLINLFLRLSFGDERKKSGGGG